MKYTHCKECSTALVFYDEEVSGECDFCWIDKTESELSEISYGDYRRGSIRSALTSVYNRNDKIDRRRKPPHPVELY